jgi:hypothetical protein
MPDDTAGNLAEPASSPGVRPISGPVDALDGRRIALDGRRLPQPAAQAGGEDAQLIRSRRRTAPWQEVHRGVGLDAGGVYVVDRGSTNGSTVSTTNGMSTRCKAAEMVRVGEGAIVSIGDHWLEITRGS